MIYKHRVKKNGIYYAAGEEVPENEESLPISDKDIVLETDAVTGEKTASRRGRPKKTE